MKLEEIQNWIIKWLEKETGEDISALQNEKDQDYFENQYIDSLGVIVFISDLEDKFQIVFSAENLQDKRFTTINGLSEIIFERLGAKN